MKKTKVPMILKTALGFTVLTALSACEPRTPAQKAEETMEDAGHEMEQGVERAGEKVEDATD